MANIVNIEKIIEGTRELVIHIYLKSDGSSGDMTDYVLIDPKLDVAPTLKGVPSFTLVELWYDLTGFDALLEFDYLAEDTGLWNLSGGKANHIDFGKFGGLKDRSRVLDGTGKLQLTTNGFLSSTDSGTIVLRLRKD